MFTQKKACEVVIGRLIGIEHLIENRNRIEKKIELKI